jgi:hypothetical protein
MVRWKSTPNAESLHPKFLPQVSAAGNRENSWYDSAMTAHPKPKPKSLTDAERHKRFVEMAREVGASKDPKDFDKAFKQVTAKRPEKKKAAP